MSKDYEPIKSGILIGEDDDMESSMSDDDKWKMLERGRCG